MSRLDRNSDGRVLVTRTGLRIPPALGFEDWERASRRIADLVGSSGWWLGDWLAFGRRRAALTFQHHAKISSLDHDAQEHLIDRALTDNA